MAVSSWRVVAMTSAMVLLFGNRPSKSIIWPVTWVLHRMLIYLKAKVRKQLLRGDICDFIRSRKVSTLECKRFDATRCVAMLIHSAQCQNEWLYFIILPRSLLTFVFQSKCSISIETAPSGFSKHSQPPVLLNARKPPVEPPRQPSLKKKWKSG